MAPEAASPAGPSIPLSATKAALFKALTHPARIRCLEVLTEGERSVGEIQPLVGIELSCLSRQLGVLHRAGLVTSRKQGSSVAYAVKDPRLIELMAVACRFLLGSLDETIRLIAELEVASSHFMERPRRRRNHRRRGRPGPGLRHRQRAETVGRPGDGDRGRSGRRRLRTSRRLDRQGPWQSSSFRWWRSSALDGWPPSVCWPAGWSGWPGSHGSAVWCLRALAGRR
jgi:DNA-binding transcriptional ArsR family regulator